MAEKRTLIGQFEHVRASRKRLIVIVFRNRVMKFAQLGYITERNNHENCFCTRRWACSFWLAWKFAFSASRSGVFNGKSHALKTVIAGTIDPEKGDIHRNSWWGCAAQFSKSWPCFRPKQAIFHTRFQTWPLKSIPIFRPGLWLCRGVN